MSGRARDIAARIRLSYTEVFDGVEPQDRLHSMERSPVASRPSSGRDFSRLSEVRKRIPVIASPPTETLLTLKDNPCHEHANFDATCDQAWNARCRELEAYKAEHGDCNVPRRHESLGSWVNTQRSARTNKKLSEERIQKLNDLGFDWGKSREYLRGPRGTAPTITRT